MLQYKLGDENENHQESFIYYTGKEGALNDIKLQKKQIVITINK
jgi:hypothetical protein